MNAPSVAKIEAATKDSSDIALVRTPTFWATSTFDPDARRRTPSSVLYMAASHAAASTAATISVTGMKPTVDFKKSVMPLEICPPGVGRTYSATPCSAPNVTSVAISGLMRTIVDSTQFNVPTAAPITKIPTMPKASPTLWISGVSTNEATTTATLASGPTDRSMAPLSITICWPSPKKASVATSGSMSEKFRVVR